MSLDVCKPVKKKRINPEKLLRTQLLALTNDIQQQQRVAAAAHEKQLLLAEGILLHKAMTEVVQPLQTTWLRQTDSSSSNSVQISWLDQPYCNPECKHLLQLAASSTHMLQAILKAHPDDIRAVAHLTTEQTVELSTVCNDHLLVLSELLQPQRYPGSLLAPAGQHSGGQADGAAHAGQDAAGSVRDPAGLEFLQPDEVGAARQLMEKLQEMRDLVNTMVTSSGVLVLHNPFLLLELHNMNLQTRESSPPSSTHYLHAAQRLRLTTEQLSHLRLILQQYNRISRQQREDGLELVGLSAHSFSLQASLAAAADRAQVSTPTTTGCSTGQQCDTASVSGLTAAALGNNSDSQSEAAARQASQQAGCEDAAEQHKDDQQAVLEGLLQQHLHNRLDTLLLVSYWVLNTLSPWQVGQYYMACWPHFGYIIPLLELSPFLTPDDSPSLHINADLCPEAAQAAVLADELGYTRPQAFMKQRLAALEQQLEWTLQYAQQRTTANT